MAGTAMQGGRAARPVAGAPWMLATGLCLVAVTAVVRHLGTGLPAAQAAFLRFGFGVVFLLPALLGVVRAGLPENGIGPFALRGAAHVAAVILWFYAMARLALVAAFATAAHYAMMRAFASVPLAVTQPVTFLQLAWATLLGVFVCDEGVDPFVLAGGAVIIAAVSFITWREAQISSRLNRVPAPPGTA